jgi:hypothetical protein
MADYLPGIGDDLSGAPVKQNSRAAVIAHAIWRTFRFGNNKSVLEKNSGTSFDIGESKLAAPPPVLNLPFDRPRPAVQSFKGAAEFLTLTASLRAQVEELGRREGATLYMVLLASFSNLTLP